jgi:hypothetical protein
MRLAGGRTAAVVIRRGDRVHRAATVNSDFVRLLLGHLQRAGFTAAPRHCGSDAEGREVFTFIDGDVPPDLAFHDDQTLVDAARLIRAFHDATEALVGAVARAAGFEIVCHNDLSPCNFVFRQGRPMAIIDFDAAAFGRRLYDVGYAAWLWLQLGDPEIAAAEQRRRLRLFAHAYGGLDIAAIVEGALIRQSILAQEGARPAKEAMGAWAGAARIWTREHLSVP